MASFCGKYNNPGYGTIEIRKEDGNLYAVHPTYKFLLEHLYYNIFVIKPMEELAQWNPEFALNFATNNNGEISPLSIKLQSEPVVFVKQIRE
ncbi:DUF3471 domain-containing protein [uncultured Salegentibacter sp.]|uniref:DUF3471 domain-containing protein n=1 Tax=uncultured Salegentibacter sp. TaxID=259320 RepID=UPI0030DBD681